MIPDFYSGFDLPDCDDVSLYVNEILHPTYATTADLLDGTVELPDDVMLELDDPFSRAA
jgi:hypothetical protein